MKARHIRKLRKKLQAYQTYRIATSYGSFGYFPQKHEWEYRKVKGASPIHAITRYMKWHFRRHKYMSRHQKTWYQETTYNWGEIEVIDEKGYIRYYH